jgi:hypothetical protein
MNLRALCHFERADHHGRRRPHLFAVWHLVGQLDLAQCVLAGILFCRVHRPGHIHGTRHDWIVSSLWYHADDCGVTTLSHSASTYICIAQAVIFTIRMLGMKWKSWIELAPWQAEMDFILICVGFFLYVRMMRSIGVQPVPLSLIGVQLHGIHALIFSVYV